jgi:hypothetical protein
LGEIRENSVCIGKKGIYHYFSEFVSPQKLFAPLFSLKEIGGN